ncbi:MAG: phosphatase PAP2 family protein [Rubrobacteraceae bacterium]
MEGRRDPRPDISPKAVLIFVASLSLGTLVAFWGLAMAVTRGDTMSIDIALLWRIHSLFPAWLEGPMIAVTSLGYYSVVTVAFAIAAYLFHRSNSKIYALFLPICALGSVVLSTTLKNLDRRARPHLFHFPSYHGPSSYAFPSGHATIAVSFWGVLVLLVALRLDGWRRWGLMGLGMVLVVLIGFSRLYLGVHYPTDVLGGYLLGTSWAAAMGTVFVFWRLRRTRGTNRRT